MSDEYVPPAMTNGKTWADEDWWSGTGRNHPIPSAIEDFSDAEALTWARCWAYGEAMGMTTREWHLMWPIVYAALNACSQIPDGAEVALGERAAYMDSPSLDPAWKAGWHSAVDHVAWRLRRVSTPARAAMKPTTTEPAEEQA